MNQESDKKLQQLIAKLDRQTSPDVDVRMAVLQTIQSHAILPKRDPADLVLWVFTSVSVAVACIAIMFHLQTMSSFYHPAMEVVQSVESLIP